MDANKFGQQFKAIFFLMTETEQKRLTDTIREYTKTSQEAINLIRFLEN